MLDTPLLEIKLRTDPPLSSQFLNSSPAPTVHSALCPKNCPSGREDVINRYKLQRCRLRCIFFYFRNSFVNDSSGSYKFNKGNWNLGQSHRPGHTFGNIHHCCGCRGSSSYPSYCSNMRLCKYLPVIKRFILRPFITFLRLSHDKKNAETILVTCRRFAAAMAGNSKRESHLFHSRYRGKMFAFGVCRFFS